MKINKINEIIKKKFDATYNKVKKAAPIIIPVVTGVSAVIIGMVVSNKIDNANKAGYDEGYNKCWSESYWINDVKSLALMGQCLGDTIAYNNAVASSSDMLGYNGDAYRDNGSSVHFADKYTGMYNAAKTI